MNRKNIGRAVAVFVAVVALWLIVGISSAQTACAHDPRFACSPRAADNAVRIPDPAKSWAYYGRLAPGATDTYTFDVPRQLGVPITLLVETADASNAARPALTIRNAAGKTAVAVDFARSQTFHEPFSGLDYLTTPDHVYVLEPGRYTAAVTMQGGISPQRYVFAIGSAEKFGLAEIPYVLGAVHRVKTRGY